MRDICLFVYLFASARVASDTITTWFRSHYTSWVCCTNNRGTSLKQRRTLRTPSTFRHSLLLDMNSTSSFAVWMIANVFFVVFFSILFQDKLQGLLHGVQITLQDPRCTQQPERVTSQHSVTLQITSAGQEGVTFLNMTTLPTGLFPLLTPLRVTFSFCF